MKVIGKIWRFLVLLVIIVIVAMVLVPYIYKDELMASLKDAINENITAEVDFEDIDISLFKSFPKVALDIQQPAVNGLNEFKGISLFNADYIRVNADLTSVFKSDQPIRIRSLEIDNADINVIVTKNGKANYDIVPPSENTSETADYVLELEDYSLTNTTINYTDHSSDVKATIEDLNHKGSGNFTADQFDLITKTSVDKLSASSGGIGYLNNVKVSADNKISVNNTEAKYTLDNNEITLNSLRLKTDGFVKMSGDNIITNLKMEAPNSDFKDFISLVPSAYKGSIKDIESKGKADVKAIVNGTYNSNTGRMPNYEVDIKVQDGYVKYPGFPKAVQDVNMDVSLMSKANNDMDINIPAFSMKSGDNFIDGNLMYQSASANPKIISNLNAKLNLDDISQSFPLEGIEQLSGEVDIQDINIDALVSDIETNNLDQVKFSGKVDMKDVNILMTDSPDVKMNQFSLTADPKNIVINKSTLELGKSDMSFDGNISNPLAYFLPDTPMKGEINIDAGKLDLNEWILTDEPVEPSTEVIVLDEKIERLARSSGLKINATADQINYYNYVIKDNQFSGNITGEKISLDNYSASIYDNDFKIEGQLEGLYDYVFSNKVLSGELNMTADKFNTNPFMESEAEPEVLEPFRVPLNMDIVINTDLKDVQYSKLNIEKMNGAITMSEGIMEFKEVLTQALGGKMNFEGVYNSLDEMPLFSLKYNMSKVKFSETFKSFASVQKLAPILEYMDGIFNSTLVMEARLTDAMVPDFGTMTAQGFIETISGKLNEIEPIKKVNNKLGIDAFDKVDLSNTKNWFEIKNGMMDIKPQKYNYKEIEFTIGGSHSFTQDMTYQAIAKVPRALLEKSNLGQLANSGLSFLEKEAGKLGMDISQGEFIDLKIDIGGSLLSPTLKITPIGSNGQNVKDQVKDEVIKKIDAVKDTLTDKANEKIKEVKDSVNTVVQTAKDSVTAVIDNAVDTVTSKVKKEVDKKVDTLKAKVNEKAEGKLDTLLNEKLKDVLGEKNEEEVDKIKDKIKDWNPFKKKKKDGGN